MEEGVVYSVILDNKINIKNFKIYGDINDRFSFIVEDVIYVLGNNFGIGKIVFKVLKLFDILVLVGFFIVIIRIDRLVSEFF